MADTRNNTWPGFAAGVVAGGTVMYLLGTKRGRELLKRVIEMSENIEADIENYLDGIEEELKAEVKERLIPILPHTPYKLEEKVSEGPLSTIIDKIKSISGTKKRGKKSYSKE